jgi:long-chain acyl-CoA synthetase
MEYAYNNFYELIRKQAKDSGKKVALFDGENRIRYAEILYKADKLAAYMADKGIGRGDKVALFLRNSPEFIYALFAVSKLGAILVPINTFLKGEELSYILEDSGTTLLIASTIHEKVVLDSRADELCMLTIWEGEMQHTDERNIPFIEAISTTLEIGLAASALDDTAVIIYTSGTTGKPKGAMLSYRNMLSNAESGRQSIGITAKDRSIVFLPMFHSFTFTIAVMLFLYVGGSIVIIRSIQPFSNIFKQVLIKKVTIFLGVPDVYSALAKAKLPWYFMWFNKLRAFISGAAALQPKTLEAMSSKFKRATLLEGYGLSEASPVVSVNTFEKQKAKSVGRALAGYEIKIVDENMVELPRGTVGDIITTGDNIMQGYLGRPEATAETIVGGWLLTGDMGYMDEEDFLFIVDRKKDLIISKGINIYPREIEEVIDTFAGIKASAVVGIIDEKSGEIPIVYIELEDDADAIDEAALRKYLREHLANYKIPKQVHTIDELPKNATGKVLKRVLKEQIRAEENELE